jgi:hypothetical protein
MAHYVSDAEGKLTKIAGKNYKAYMPLGMVFASAVMLEEISVKRLDGQSLSITGTYKDFCNWVMNQGANVPTCNISTYASEMTAYGQCGKFVINNTSSAQTSGSYTVPAYSIKLPTITEFVASNNGGDAIGLAELDGFKQHRHVQTAAGYNYIEDHVTTSGTQGTGSAKGNRVSGEYIVNGLWTLSTRDTGGEETRPKNIRYPYYVVVAQGVKPIALADMTKKAEKDGSNLTDADVESWQKKLGTFEYVGKFTGTMPSISGINLDKYDYMFVVAMGTSSSENLMVGFTNGIPFTNIGLEQSGYYGCYLTWAKETSAVVYLSKPTDTSRTAEFFNISKDGSPYAFTSSPLTDTVIFHGGATYYNALGYCEVKMYRSLKK